MVNGSEFSHLVMMVCFFHVVDPSPPDRQCQKQTYLKCLKHGRHLKYLVKAPHIPGCHSTRVV